ncbi:MAG: response regulator transcription factor [Herminiimonas sp.]|nr:response regulator transcription factor [Herminiimonas sp.]
MKQTAQTPLPSTRGHLRVFIVEDSALVRELIIENLSRINGVDIVGFSDTESDALAQLAELECDVMVLDIELKHGNGLNVLRTLRENQMHGDDLKIIFSNNVSNTYRRLGEQYGVDHFFDKTSEFSNLYSLIEQLGTCSSSQ